MTWVLTGRQSESGAAQTLVESWNGSAWTVAGSPNASTQTNQLSAVSCSGPAFCVAVGYYIDANGQYDTLVESWNGSAWTIAPSPNASTQNSLQGVSCLTPTRCTAVGNYFAGGSTSDTLIESWNGSAWTIVASPNASTQNSLQEVSCTGPKFCAAVGSSIELWNGSTWTIANAPRGGTLGSHVEPDTRVWPWAPTTLAAIP